VWRSSGGVEVDHAGYVVDFDAAGVDLGGHEAFRLRPSSKLASARLALRLFLSRVPVISPAMHVAVLQRFHEADRRRRLVADEDEACGGGSCSGSLLGDSRGQLLPCERWTSGGSTFCVLLRLWRVDVRRRCACSP